MPWFRLDDCADEHQKVAGLSLIEFAVWVKGGLYCARNLTDGKIPQRKALELASGALEHDVDPRTVLKALADAGLWVAVDDGLNVHDYLDYNPSKEKVDKDRADAKTRKERWKERREEQRRNAVPNGVKNGKGTAVERTPPNPNPSPKKNPPTPLGGIVDLASQQIASAVGAQSDKNTEHIAATVAIWRHKYPGVALSRFVASVLEAAQDSGKLAEWQVDAAGGKVKPCVAYVAAAVRNQSERIAAGSKPDNGAALPPELNAEEAFRVAVKERLDEGSLFVVQIDDHYELQFRGAVKRAFEPNPAADDLAWAICVELHAEEYPAFQSFAKVFERLQC